ncbi:glycosyltransferase [Actinomadura monticuli]|uniref:Glycosyltransferase n=1 Tax=Actinomadura monticuli TaxID=3097367 RepID=A0ABV4Q622_9ACTN
MTQRRPSARRVQVPSILGDPAVRRARTPERRFLFAVPPLAGRIAPAAAVAAELGRRGHKVAWTGHRPALEALLRPGARIFSAGDDAAAARDRWLELRGLDALRFLWEDFLVPLGHAMLPGVERAMDRFHPDVVVSDQAVLAAPVAARRRGIPWATSAASPAEFTRPLADLPEVEAEIRDHIGGFQLDHGIDDLIDLRFSDHLTLVFSTAALVGDTSFFPDHFAFVGPARGRPAPCPFPWEWLDGRPAVLVSLGRIAGPSADRFVRAAAEAVRGLDVQAVVAAPPEAVTDPPPNVLVRDRVPRHKLLERLSAVVCHAGHSAVCESLAHGLPLVVAPVRDDQPVIARRVEAAGAGVRVGFDEAGPDGLRAALAAVLADGPHRAAAEAARASFASAGGAAEAADRLEKIA